MISQLDNKYVVGITVNDANDEIIFQVKDSPDSGVVEQYKMYHDRNCCESVYIEDITGNIQDLVGQQILSATENTSSDLPAKDEYDDSHTWTFYNIRTLKDTITIRWYGTSNGYYSERVDVVRVDDTLAFED